MNYNSIYFILMPNRGKGEFYQAFCTLQFTLGRLDDGGVDE